MKKCLLALLACCLLVASLFGGASYFFRKQVEAQLAALPEEWSVEACETSLLSRSVRLRGLHLVLPDGKGFPLVCDIATVDATLSWRALLASLPVPGQSMLPREGDITVLDALILDVLSQRQQQFDGSHLSFYVKKGILRQVTLPVGTFRDGLQNMPDVTDTLLGQFSTSDMQLQDVQQHRESRNELLSSLSCSSLRLSQVSARRIQSVRAQGLVLELDDMQARADALESRDLILPTPELMRLVSEASQPEEIQQLLQEFYAEQPAFSLLKFSDAALLDQQRLMLSLGEIQLDWLQDGAAQILGSSLRDLNIPALVIQSLLPVKLPGLDALHINGNGTIRCADGLAHTTGSLTVDSVAGLAYSYDVPSAGVLVTRQDNLSNLDMTLTDKGLMALIALNISPDAATSRMILSAGTVALNDGSEHGAAVSQALQTFIARPGTLRLTSQPDTPLSLAGADAGSLLPLLHLTATPGPRTLESLVEALSRATQ